MNNESNIKMHTKLTKSLVKKCLAATWFVILSTLSVLGFSTNNVPLEALSIIFGGATTLVLLVYGGVWLMEIYDSLDP